jgi:hypothetical protein
VERLDMPCNAEHPRKLPRQYVCSQHFSETDFTLGDEQVWTDRQFQMGCLYKDTDKVFTVSVYFPFTSHNSVHVQLRTSFNPLPPQGLKIKLCTEILADILTVTKHF